MMERSPNNLAWRVAPAIFFSLVIMGRSVAGDDITHKYKKNEEVIVWLNKVGPWYNPQESYPYYNLPYCEPESHRDKTKKRRSTTGEILAGNRLRNSGIDIRFGVNEENGAICSQTLNEESTKIFQRMVHDEYFANIYVDDLPLYAQVGVVIEDEELQALVPRINVHQSYTISYNQDRIIQVEWQQGNPQPIEKGAVLDFTYEVKWQTTETTFEDRFNFYLASDFYEHKIHWFSIFHSFMMVIFLCGLVALILVRTLKNDFARYLADDDDMEATEVGEDSGWRLIHGDVFRAPKHLMLFSALYGTGCQLTVLVLIAILYAIAGPLHGDVYEERGEMVATFSVGYTLTSFIAGYTSGSYYRQFFTTPRAEQSSQWQKTMLLSAVLVPSILVPVVSFLNIMSITKGTVYSIPFVTVLKILLVWLFVAFPLCVAGSMFGRHWGGKGNFPCRVNSIPRPIPEGPWYAQPLVVIPLAGILPFGSIFIEMYFILTSFWSYIPYYVFGFLLLVFGFLLLVLVCITIVAVYFVLNAENYHWHWVSFLSAGSTAGYVFLYSMYYFSFKTSQKGFLQTSHYFGYMGLFCAALFVMCGSIGVTGGTVFVKQIYRNIKVD